MIKVVLFRQQKRKPQGAQFLGVFYSVFYGGLNHRLVTDYLSPSNQLLMKWLTTPAATAIINDKSVSTSDTSFLSPDSEAVTLAL